MFSAIASNVCERLSRTLQRLCVAVARPWRFVGLQEFVGNRFQVTDDVYVVSVRDPFVRKVAVKLPKTGELGRGLTLASSTMSPAGIEPTFIFTTGNRTS